MSELIQIEGTGGDPRAGRRHPERPPWIRVRFRDSEKLRSLRELVKGQRLHTVCESAACPNLSECWSAGTATFMLGGKICTRRCGFCDVETGRPEPLEPEEPERVAQAIHSLGLSFAVVTAVARDDLSDGGAAHFARTIEAIRAQAPGCRVEVLIPDFKGCPEALTTVLDAEPDVLNHNLETVERLQRRVRPQAKYVRSLQLLARSRELRPAIPTKTGIMLGLGERHAEIQQTLEDILGVGCRLLTIGQYLQPSARHLPVERWVPPEEFGAWEHTARELGFDDVASGPLVRSSYRAEKLARRTS